MANRNYIQTAEPYAQINSTCFVASVQMNNQFQKKLTPVYLPVSYNGVMPTDQNTILRLMNGIEARDEVNTDVVTMVQATAEWASTIDGVKAEMDFAKAHGVEVDTESF